MSLRKNCIKKIGVSENIIHKRIRDSKRMTLKEMLKNPYLQEYHEATRLNRTKKLLAYGDNGLSTIFSD